VSDRESLIDKLVGGAAGESEDPRAAQFVRGLAVGALVGAAIAGSTIWQRRRASARPGDVPATPALLPPDASPEISSRS
jgi:hypothetical protein